jgi:hypothetical protein
VPEVRQFCTKQEECYLQDPGVMIKRVTIFVKLLAELINDFSDTISNRGLVVLALLVFVASVTKRMFLSTNK